MTEIVTLSLENREDFGKEANKKLRKEGYIPAVFYGQEYKDSLRVKVKNSDLSRYANSSHWETVRFEVTLPGGKRELCLMREIQRDILNDEILHVDFIQLVKGHKVHVKVPV
ncbi:MAG: 50S ribosomal protein L25, partial [Synergistales bacterium]|nr:50S ribosomal protein L25 [Synergistales bacterium]